MRCRLLIALAVLGVGGCTPTAIEPTLADVRALGFACGDGVRDNVPSGLSQWHCSGRIATKEAAIAVNGSEAGVTEIDLVINSPDPELMRSAFMRVATDVTPLKVGPALRDALAGWSGQQRTTVVGSARVASECDTTQCIVEVTSMDGSLRPLRLP